MKHKVLKPFVDKVTGEEFTLSPNTFYICDDYERVNELHELGFIRKNDESEKLKKPNKPTNTRKKASD